MLIRNIRTEIIMRRFTLRNTTISKKTIKIFRSKFTIVPGSARNAPLPYAILIEKRIFSRDRDQSAFYCSPIGPVDIQSQNLIVRYRATSTRDSCKPSVSKNFFKRHQFGPSALVSTPHTPPAKLTRERLLNSR